MTTSYDYDVIVAGAGPSGSSTALRLARAGRRVLLLDKQKFPRVKPCGGGVTARALAQAPVDLTPVIERRVSRVRFSFRLEDGFEYQFPETLVYMTQRQKLDAYLASQAAAAGANFDDDCALVGVRQDADGVEIETESGARFRAKVLVGADGANGIVARSVNLDPVTNPPVALEANFPYAGNASEEWDGTFALELGSMPGGYGWSFPKEDHLNVGCGGWHSEGGRLRSHLAALRSHYELDDWSMVNLRGHHLPTRTDGAPIVRDHVLLVGDAAGLVDPMSGEGIMAAFLSARLAAESIERYLDGREPDLLRYEEEVEREIMADIRAAGLLRDAFHSNPTLCFFMMKHNALFRRMLCEVMAGKRSYVEFVRWLGPAALGLRVWAAWGRKMRGNLATA
ncbi:MAG: geranylgeranyl reductase family protein [Dehalococcoidia bacterium]